MFLYHSWRDQTLVIMDLFLPNLWDQKEPIELMLKQQESNPVVWCANSLKGEHWSVLSDEHVREVLLDHNKFSSKQLNRYTDFSESSSGFISADPPEHTLKRKPLNGFFNTESMAEFSSYIRETILDIFDSLPIGETFDWVSLVAEELPLRVLCHLIDYPQEERKEILLLCKQIKMKTELMQGGGKKAPKILNDQEMNEINFERKLIHFKFFKHFSQVRAEYSKKKENTFISALAEISDDDFEFYANLLTLIVGSIDTMITNISDAVLMLDQNDIQLTPENIDGATNEIIRLSNAFRFTLREATCDTELAGNMIRKGDILYVWIMAANRDPKVYDDPKKFNIQRTNSSNNLSFGHGVHKCLGYRLGQLQLKILLEELSKGYKVNVVGTPKRVHSFADGSYENVPVKLEKF